MTHELITSDPPRPQQGGALADLRAGAMSAPVDVQEIALAEYSERRASFRQWLKSQLVSGVHYGYSPGFEPKYDEKGNLKVWNKKLNNGAGGYMHIPPEQWQAKPSFYAAGADFVCDLLGLRAEYKADVDSWTQIGSPKDTFVMACYLRSKQTGELLGEGRGARKSVGDANQAIKMAQKSSKVAAVLDTYGLRDLFTQDLESIDQPEQNDNPSPDEHQPHVDERENRMTPDEKRVEVTRLASEWKSRRTEVEGSFDAWSAFVCQSLGRQFDVKKPSQWTAADLHAVAVAIDKDMGL